jgi:hypothetical protein
MCTVLLTPGGYPTVANKIYHIIPMTIYCHMPELLGISWDKYTHTDHFAEQGTEGRMGIKLP